MSAKITLIGMNNYYVSTYNKNLFNDILLPDGIDKDILVNNILLDLGEYEVIYSKPEFLKLSIEQFFNKHTRTFSKWVTALSIDYNPLENYDRQEEWTDNGSSNSSSTGNSSVTSSNSTSGESQISAFDSSSYQPDNKNTASTSSSTGSTDNATNNESSNSTHSGRLHGNIGVTTSQQMLQAELDIDMWNIYSHITDLFGTELLIMVED